MTTHFLHNTIQRTHVWEVGGKVQPDGNLTRTFEVTARQELALREVVTGGDVGGVERAVASKLADRVRQFLSGKIYIVHEVYVYEEETNPAGTIRGIFYSRIAAQKAADECMEALRERKCDDDHRISVIEWDIT